MTEGQAIMLEEKRLADEQQKQIDEKKSNNPYWENICKMAEKQRAKGIDTYGQGLEENPADLIQRIEHLQEELIDGLMYCQWIKDKLMEGKR